MNEKVLVPLADYFTINNLVPRFKRNNLPVEIVSFIFHLNFFFYTILDVH